MSKVKLGKGLGVDGAWRGPPRGVSVCRQLCDYGCSLRRRRAQRLAVTDAFCSTRWPRLSRNRIARAASRVRPSLCAINGRHD